MATFEEIKKEANGDMSLSGFQLFPYFNLDDNSAFNKHYGTNDNIYTATTVIVNEKDRQVIPLGEKNEDLSIAIIKLMRFAHKKIVENLNAEIEDLKKQITPSADV